MPLNDFRSVFLPYCIKKQADGSYIVLNREYKPIGFNSRKHVKYEDYPISSKIRGLTPASIKKLSWNGIMREDGSVFLYNDGSIPTDSAANMKKYLEKLAILASYKIKAV